MSKRKLTAKQASSLATMATTVLMADAAKRTLMEAYGWPEEQAVEFVALLVTRAGDMGAKMRENAEQLGGAIVDGVVVGQETAER